jgi:hypothetical protein
MAELLLERYFNFLIVRFNLRARSPAAPMTFFARKNFAFFNAFSFLALKNASLDGKLKKVIRPLIAWKMVYFGVF